MISALVATPTNSPICWRWGVAPTRKPVLRSWLVSPAMAAAMQTTAPTDSTAYLAPAPAPKATKRDAVMSSVAMVMPLTGLLLEPMRPTMRLETVTKTKAKTRMASAPPRPTGRMLSGSSHMSRTSATATVRTQGRGRSRCVRRAAGTASPPASRFAALRPAVRPATPARKLWTRVGRLLIRVMMPPKATAPAPTSLTYSPRMSSGAISGCPPSSRK